MSVDIKQLLDEVEHDITNYQNRGLCSASADKNKPRSVLAAEAEG